MVDDKEADLVGIEAQDQVKNQTDYWRRVNADAVADLQADSHAKETIEEFRENAGTCCRSQTRFFKYFGPQIMKLILIFFFRY